MKDLHLYGQFVIITSNVIKGILSTSYLRASKKVKLNNERLISGFNLCFRSASF